MPQFRTREITHRVNETALQSELRVDEILEIVDRDVVEGQADIPHSIRRISALLLLRQQALDNRAEWNDLVTSICYELEIDGKGDVVVEAVLGRKHMMRVIGQDDGFQAIVSAIRLNARFSTA